MSMHGLPFICTTQRPDIIEKVDAQTPPAFVFSTFEDTVTPPRHPMAFAQALDAANVPFELHIFVKGPHGLSLGKEATSWGRPEMINDAFAQWFPLGLRWLKTAISL